MVTDLQLLLKVLSLFTGGHSQITPHKENNVYRNPSICVADMLIYLEIHSVSLQVNTDTSVDIIYVREMTLG